MLEIQTTNLARDGVSSLDYTLLNAEFVTDAGFLIGFGYGIGGVASRGLYNVAGRQAAGFSIGYAQLGKGVQYAFLYTHRRLRTRLDEQYFMADTNATFEIDTSGYEFEIGYGF